MKRNYTQWVQWLETRNVMPQIRPGLEHTKAAMNEAGLLQIVNPHKVVHIAGTNGKGTTAKTLEQLLLSQNKKVGLYTSPHLVDTTERIRRNGDSISQNHFVELCEKYESLIEKWNLSHFESLTLFSADVFFLTTPVDYAIYEIGLGGTWDATNVIPHQTSVVVTLGFDHQHILGNTLREIADNKFGIIQNKNHVIHRPYDADISSLLLQKLKHTESTNTCVSSPQIEVDQTTAIPSYSILVDGQRHALALPGLRSAENMWLALHVFEHLGFSKTEGLQQLSKIQWPARMTPLNQKTVCPVFLSGDHNIQGVESLKEILQFFKYKNLKIVFGLSKNRSHDEFLKILSLIPRSQIILTKPKFNGIAPESSELTYFENPIAAVNHALSLCDAQDLIVITGSLYLCGDVLKQASEVHAESDACRPLSKDNDFDPKTAK